MANTEITSLVFVTRAEKMLTEANTLQEIKEFKNTALTAADWARRMKKGDANVKLCLKYARMAEDKMGAVLVATKPKRAKGGGRHGKAGQKAPITAGDRCSDEPTLADMDITPNESWHAQELHNMPAAVKAAVIGGTMTRVAAKRTEKEKKREKRRTANKTLIANAADPVASGAKYATIVVDPPWDWGDEGDQDQLGRARPEYATMSLESLLELPVAEMADTDCHLYLWITNRSLPKGFQLIEKWGFRYVTCLTWCKPSFGLGNYFRGQTEHLLFAVKGSQQLNRKDVGTWFAAPRGEGHSAKPEEAYALIESCSPGPWLELFARKERARWVCTGGEIGTKL